MDLLQHILLQTATAIAFNPEDPSKMSHVHIVLDTGSQNSYITDAARNQLSLRISGEQSMSIVTFGSSEAQRRVCEYMRVGLKCRDDSMMYLTVFPVPTICQPIVPHSVADCHDRFPHLAGLELADDICTRSPLGIALLIGSDHYWEFLTGRIRRGREGPVAIETRLGWVLSGPVFSRVEDTTLTGLMTYTLHVGAEYQETQKLDGTLKSFWELESFGIPPNDKTVYDNFCEKI